MKSETMEAADLARAEARLPKWMMAGGAVATVAIVAGGHVRLAAGFALGAAIAVLNYFWLHEAIGALFDGGSERVPRGLIVRFAIRYPLAFAGVYLFYRTGWLPIAAILAGLFVPVAGVVCEAVLLLVHGFKIPAESELDKRQLTTDN